MNQILDTGEEQFKNNNINYGNYNQNKKQKVYKEKSVIEINKIVIFIAISILILGICIIAGSIYAKDKINKNIEAIAKCLGIKPKKVKEEINKMLVLKTNELELK